ncbi:MAG: peptide chain release factor N(5)-glutamine methyltransferase [Lentisphaerae bacterium]|nr:peptide chain release factor N(5)-glutamine methyltransferase [Lentisphaerota bacterium]
MLKNEKIFYSGELLDRMTAAFTAHNMEQAQAEAVAIISELLDCNRVMAQLDRKRQLTPELWARGLEIIERRLHNEPWQYIFQRAYFRDLTLKVTPAVLIPRPETEILVDWCIDILPEGGKVLDLGTGSGAIALSVATERPDARVTACDVSRDALAVAAENAQNTAPGRVRWVESDLFSDLQGEKFDLIAANLPYVTENEHLELSPEVRLFEPKLALTSGEDGLELIRKTVVQAAGHLSPHGAIILEMSSSQTGTVAELFCETLQYCAIEIIKDYTQRDRFVAARLR